ncbi:hypothetical protein [Nonomuraea dietziae]|uniref:hypothetical protein n=1 Tax=Nonomuraea dietziae TaxID=65515 RepID=UPI00342A95D5
MMVTQRRMTLPPGLPHEMPLEMIQRRPGFARELLALATDGDPTGYGDVRLESVDMNIRDRACLGGNRGHHRSAGQ